LQVSFVDGLCCLVFIDLFGSVILFDL
jgi:hypothetical protein